MVPHLEKKANTILFLFQLFFLIGCQGEKSEEKVRVGYLPNLMHAQAIIGISNGKFQERLGKEYQVEPRLFFTGSSVVEALFADAIDIGYLGPGPAINAYLKSGGLFKIVAGASSGGGAFIVQNDSKIDRIEDLNGKKIATPQLGNTQDIVARTWLKQNGLGLKEKGGSVDLLPISNPELVALFLKKDLDGGWLGEPWASYLVFEGKGRIFLDESEFWRPITGGQFATALILASEKFIKKNPDILKKWIQVHCELTEWIHSNPTEAKKIAREEIKKITRLSLSEKVIDAAFSRIEFTYDPIKKSVFYLGKLSFEQGFLGKKEPELSKLFDLSLLNETLREKKRTLVEE